MVGMCLQHLTSASQIAGFNIGWDLSGPIWAKTSLFSSSFPHRNKSIEISLICCGDLPHTLCDSYFILLYNLLLFFFFFFFKSLLGGSPTWFPLAVKSAFFTANIVHISLCPPWQKKTCTRHSCAQKADFTVIGNHVGDPPNNDLKKEKTKKKILQQNEIGITQRHSTAIRK